MKVAKELRVEVPPETHKAIKMAAAERGETMQTLTSKTLSAAFQFQRPDNTQSAQR